MRCCAVLCWNLGGGDPVQPWESPHLSRQVCVPSLGELAWDAVPCCAVLIMLLCEQQALQSKRNRQEQVQQIWVMHLTH